MPHSRKKITLEQALIQGGVHGFQDLIINTSTRFQFVFGEDTFVVYVGLLLNDITFNIRENATVTINNDIGGEYVGCTGLINGGKLINSGKITINGSIFTHNNVATDAAAGITLFDNTELINRQTGVIEFNSEISSNTMSLGIQLFENSKFLNDGKIYFNRIISTSGLSEGILLNDNSEFKNGQTGIIKFNGEINGPDTPRGISIEQRGEFLNNGKISFVEITSTNDAEGIFLTHNSEFKNGQTGIIKFNGQINGNESLGFNIDHFAKFLNNGKISFVEITATNDAEGILLIDNSEFINNESGIIEFNGEISGVHSSGINIEQRGEFFNDGKISFAEITATNDAEGIFLTDNSEFTNEESGIIRFNGEIRAETPEQTLGITIDVNSELLTNGNITFVNELSTVTNDPDDPMESPTIQLTGQGLIGFNRGAEMYYNGSL